MRKPVLFLIRPNSRPDRPEGWYCPDCALIEGVLQYYPQLREAIEVVMVDFPRPRTAIIAAVGEAYQDCPCLLVDPAIAPPGGQLANGWAVISENKKLLLDTLPKLAGGVGYTGTGTIF
jgi:hypothetical protein